MGHLSGSYLTSNEIQWMIQQAFPQQMDNASTDHLISALDWKDGVFDRKVIVGKEACQDLPHTHDQRLDAFVEAIIQTPVLRTGERFLPLSSVTNRDYQKSLMTYYRDLSKTQIVKRLAVVMQEDRFNAELSIADMDQLASALLDEIGLMSPLTSGDRVAVQTMMAKLDIVLPDVATSPMRRAKLESALKVVIDEHSQVAGADAGVQLKRAPVMEARLLMSPDDVPQAIHLLTNFKAELTAMQSALVTSWGESAGTAIETLSRQVDTAIKYLNKGERFYDGAFNTARTTMSEMAAALRSATSEESFKSAVARYGNFLSAKLATRPASIEVATIVKSAATPALSAEIAMVTNKPWMGKGTMWGVGATLVVAAGLGLWYWLSNDE